MHAKLRKPPFIAELAMLHSDLLVLSGSGGILFTMPELLLEVGCEELPATFVKKAYQDLRDKLFEELSKSFPSDQIGEITAYGTPRRLIIGVANLPEREEDSTKEVRGPGLKAAYGPDGAPSNALLGFCRSSGVTPEELTSDEQYVWLKKKIVGRPTSELLSSVLPAVIRSLTFEKSMRWGSSRMRFARPIRWLLAVFDGQTVPFEIEGIESGSKSKGHRFYAPEEFSASTLARLLADLRTRFVEPDVEKRKALIHEQSKTVAHGLPQLPTDLVDENAFLTEWPSALAGHFREEHLELPVSVLTTAMAKHEKMFPVLDHSSKMTNQFIFIRNSGIDEDVRRGTEWVLNARLDDARFFYQEDAKGTLDDFLEQTAQIVFQNDLGTVRKRADRLAQLSAAVAKALGANETLVEAASTAGKYAKADLSTGLVGELASLQGIIGADYGRREGFSEEIAYAIESQYRLEVEKALVESKDIVAASLLAADSLDKLAGYLGLGLAPTGSSDPYGLRRAATSLIRIGTHSQTRFDIGPLFVLGLKLFTDQGVTLKQEEAPVSLRTLLASRYPILFVGARPDVVEAALGDSDSSAVTQPALIATRLRVLEDLKGDTAFVQTAKRPLNIVAAARKNKVAFSEAGEVAASELSTAEETNLLAAAQKVRPELVGKIAEPGTSGTQALVALCRELEGPINAFFEVTMVMVDDEAIRNARLSLLQFVCLTLLECGDFTKLVIEG